MKKLIALVYVFACGAVQAALIDRGGGFIYDDVLDITWLQDANFAQTSGYDADGRMLHSDAMAWAHGLNVYDSERDIFYDDWRLPMTLQADSSCSEQNGLSTGYNCTGSEMGHLFYVDGVTSNSPGLFTNLENRYAYWSGTVSANDFIWRFHYTAGLQRNMSPTSLGQADLYAWAVRDGDVVPIPAAIWLFASGLGLLGGMRRRRTT